MFPRQQSPLKYGKSGHHGKDLEVVDADDVVDALKGRGQLEDVLWLVGVEVCRVKTGEESECILS